MKPLWELDIKAPCWANLRGFLKDFNTRENQDIIDAFILIHINYDAMQGLSG